MKDYKFNWITQTDKDGAPITRCSVRFYEGGMQLVEKSQDDKTLVPRYIRSKFLHSKEFEYKGHLSSKALEALLDKELINVK